jgi:hypothetical protein
MKIRLNAPLAPAPDTDSEGRYRGHRSKSTHLACQRLLLRIHPARESRERCATRGRIGTERDPIFSAYAVIP